MRAIAILGAGLIGCEFADDLAGAGHAVTMVDPNPLPLSALAAPALSQGLRQALQARMGELLTEAGVDIRQGADPQLTSRERELSQQLAAKAQRLTQRNTPEQLATLKKEIAQLEADYEQVQGAIRRNSPRYAGS